MQRETFKLKLVDPIQVGDVEGEVKKALRGRGMAGHQGGNITVLV